jgi:hypothetical protein
MKVLLLAVLSNPRPKRAHFWRDMLVFVLTDLSRRAILIDRAPPARLPLRVNPQRPT